MGKVLRNVSLDDKYKLNQTKAYLTSIEALVRLPILQHQRDQERGLNTVGFVSGYRGSPLGGVDQAMWGAQEYLDKHNITFVPGVKEELAATAVRGYGHVKHANYQQYRLRLTQQLKRYQERPLLHVEVAHVA